MLSPGGLLRHIGDKITVITSDHAYIGVLIEADYEKVTLGGAFICTHGEFWSGEAPSHTHEVVGSSLVVLLHQIETCYWPDPFCFPKQVNNALPGE